MDISVVIPLYNEEESLGELFDWIKRVMDENKFSYEVIFVNDGSTDHSWDRVLSLKQEHPEVKGIKFRRNYGKSAALFCGFEKAQGNVVITMTDNGEGMTDEVKQHLFENFFTTKPVGKGTGLGMGITRDIIENKHGGRITFDSTVGEGTTFTFIIPIKK